MQQGQFSLSWIWMVTDTQSVLLDAPHIPAGMWGFCWNPPESTGMGPESTGMGLESTGMRLDSTGIELESAGMTLFLLEWNILNKIAYIYICLYLLNSLCVYKCYICIYWSAYIYLNYNLVPFNIKNLDGLKTHRHVFWALFFHVSPLLLCHTYSQL